MTSYNHDLWCTIDTNEVVTIVQKYNVQMDANEKFSWDVILIYLGKTEKQSFTKRLHYISTFA